MADAQPPAAPSRALLVREPWIGLILSGRKDWEMRGRATAARGLVGLIRSGSGTVVGLAEILGCGDPLDERGLLDNVHRHGIPSERIREVAARGWVVPWLLGGVRPLRRPVPYRHPQGAVGWVRLEPEVSAAVLAAA